MITTFDAVHDQADPQGMFNGTYRSLAPGRSWLCVDIQGSSHVGENLAHPLGTFMYSVSCSHCMTVSLADDGEGLGAMWGVQKAREVFSNAGFNDIAVHNIQGDPMNNYDVCHKTQWGSAQTRRVRCRLGSPQPPIRPPPAADQQSPTDAFQARSGCACSSSAAHCGSGLGAHEPMARAAGLAEEVILAIKAGHEPGFTDRGDEAA